MCQTVHVIVTIELGMRRGAVVSPASSATFVILMTKRLFFLPLLCLALATASFAEEAKPAPAPAPDFSSFKTADALWNQLEKLQQEQPEEAPVTPTEAQGQLKAWLTNLKTAAEVFVKQFPSDSRVWQVRALQMRVDSHLVDRDPTPEGVKAFKEELEAMINAPDAPAPLKGEAAFEKAQLLVNDLDKKKPETYAAFYQAAADFLKKYAEHPMAGEMKTLEMQILYGDWSPQGGEALNKLAKSEDPRLAEAAKNLLAYRAKIAELKTKPFELQYTAVDGQPVDVASYRGKVVLLDFWASWCGVCIKEMPEVVSTYGKLHDKGLEILGISLDQDKDEMAAALKKQNMTWSQYFDGNGWDGKIARAYGISQLPSSFLIDKKGMLREVGLHGDEIEGEVEKLLAE